MNEIAIYLLKSSLWTGILWTFYQIFLRKETFFRFNRFFLISGLLLIIIAPILRFHYSVTPDMNGTLAFIARTTALSEPTGKFNLVPILLLFYIVIALSIIARHGIFLYKIDCIIKKHGGAKIITTPNFKDSFSLFGYVFLDSSFRKTPMEKEMILQHELAHIEQRHSIDLLAAHLLCVFQWFNPFAWLYLSAIRQNHEFLADAAVVKLGHSTPLYRAAIVNNQFGATLISFAHSFSHGRPNRIGMIGHAPSSPWRKMSVALLLPIVIFLFVVFAKPVFKTTPLTNESREIRSYRIQGVVEGGSGKLKQIIIKRLTLDQNTEM